MNSGFVSVGSNAPKRQSRRRRNKGKTTHTPTPPTSTSTSTSTTNSNSPIQSPKPQQATSTNTPSSSTPTPVSKQPLFTNNRAKPQVSQPQPIKSKPKPKAPSSIWEQRAQKQKEKQKAMSINSDSTKKRKEKQKAKSRSTRNKFPVQKRKMPANEPHHVQKAASSLRSKGGYKPRRISHSYDANRVDMTRKQLLTTHKPQIAAKQESFPSLQQSLSASANKENRLKKSGGFRVRKVATVYDPNSVDMTKKQQAPFALNKNNYSNTFTAQSQSQSRGDSIRSKPFGGLSSRSKGYRAQSRDNNVRSKPFGGSVASVRAVQPIQSIRPPPIRPVC